MKILVLNGPNINFLGIREPEIYGKGTYEEMLAMISKAADERGIDVEFFQSNHEGALIDKIQQAYGNFDGIVFNPAGYSHTSIALADAIKAVGIRTVEVHISDISKREVYRRHSFISEAACTCIKGHGFDGYVEAIDILTDV